MPFGKCKGFCELESFEKNIAKRREYGKFYINGCGRCTACELFLKPGISKCPCCNRKVKTRPVHMAARRKLIEQLTIKRI